MTQTDGEHDQSWRSPWAAPGANDATVPFPAGESTTPGTPDPDAPVYQPPAAPTAAYPPGYAPACTAGQPPAFTTGQPPAYAAGQPAAYGTGQGYPAASQVPPTSAFPPPPPAERAPRRGPGWVALIAAAGGSAVLASLLTAGIVNSSDTASPVPTSSSQGSQQAVTGPVTSSTAQNPDWAKVAAAVERAVVSVQVTTSSGGGEGSGVILDKQGHVLTNNHVVGGADSIVVMLSDGRGYVAKVVGTDASTDIAVIKISNPPADLTTATLGDSNAVEVGDPVMAVGNPLGLADTVTTGIVSAVNRPVTTSASQQEDPFGGSAGSAESVVTNAIQTDAAVNPGNSGGALVDVQGRVIGITSSIASLGSSATSQSGSIGLGFAIPINEVKDVTDQLMKSGSVQHAFMGVSLSEKSVTVDGAMRQAAVVAQVNSGAPAAKAGLKVDDAIIAIDGESVNGRDSLIAQVRERRPGTAVKLTVVRGGKTQEITITLGTKPAS